VNLSHSDYSEKLRQRKTEIARTLRHIAKERREVENNVQWIDRSGFESRIRLLESLSRWYQDEAAQIDGALDRSKKSRYGLCFACREPIEPGLLEKCAETEFCLDCREYQDTFKTW
jgi:RNA polymerase-binding transcription factor DksA